MFAISRKKEKHLKWKRKSVSIFSLDISTSEHKSILYFSSSFFSFYVLFGSVCRLHWFTEVQRKEDYEHATL